MKIIPLRLVVLFCACGPLTAVSVEPTELQHIVARRVAPESHSGNLQLQQLSQPIRRHDLQLEPAASCAATACHGGPRGGVSVATAVRGSEYPLWLTKDPHAQSWRTLSSDASVQIMERLNIMRDGEVIDTAGFDNCLACHNTSRSASDGASSDLDHFIAEGVGCSSCHGPSQNWRKDHYRFSWDDASSAHIGLVPTENLLARARTCAACHVGDEDRDMNHDIIAAGHPALHYEFATFHNMLPKHWREPEKTQAADFEARLWFVGQVAALDASLSLLETRAAKRLHGSTWPEFAASDCSSCHQSLRVGREDYAGAQVNAAASFSSWNRFGVERLLEWKHSGGQSTPADRQLKDTLDHLSQLMNMQAVPDRQAVQTAAHQARVQLDQWLNQQGPRGSVPTFTANQLAGLAAASLGQPAELDRWEYASQGYLAVIAARQSWLGLPVSTTPLQDVDQLRTALLFKPGTNSPLDPNDSKADIAAISAVIAKALASSKSTDPAWLPSHPGDVGLDNASEMLFLPVPIPVPD